MSTSLRSDTFTELLTLARAGANVLHVASFEWERVRGLAIGLASELGLDLEVWSHSSGLSRLTRDGVDPADESARDPLRVLRDVGEQAHGSILLLEDFHPFLDHHEIVRQARELCRLPREPRRIVLLSTPSPSLPMELGKEVATLELPLPGVPELRQVACAVAAEQGVELTRDDERLLQAARGLTVMEARLAFGSAAARHRRLGESAVTDVAAAKERVIRQTQVLEYHAPDARLDDVGGLDALKLWLERRGRAFGPGAADFGLEPPRGCMLLGVQGCGKSLTARAVAAAWQFPLLRFDLGRVFGGIVGESEANIRRALQVAQALAPCVLWIDEIEKGLAGMGSSDRSDGGTTARVVGTLLTWMQEKTEPVFVVATANRIDMLPPELLRKGRFDEIFFADLPTCAVRREILAIHLRRRGRDPARFDLDALAEQSRGFSGAELEEAVREGLFAAFADGRELTTADITEAISHTSPLSRTMHDAIVGLRQWASARARAACSERPEPLSAVAESNVPRLRQEMSNPFVPGSAS